ncbi:hypothetical protein ASD81_17795 [Nocardioides sp. Root614]|nr:hypothetical protein ASD81_17795 [Nocardioides sp. Root614]KRA87921.1 hypothetical protein ASD84_18070 [Nocardioides sp. Root682]
MLCVATLGASVLGALPAAAALEAPWLVVYTPDPLLNENGDGYWDSATVEVGTNADTAHWALSTGGQVVAEADLTETELASAHTWDRASLPVSSTTTGVTLAAGTYTFTVTATTTGGESTTSSTNLYVSTAAPLTPWVPSAAVLYPHDYYPGVAHSITLRHGVDATIAEWGWPRFELIGPDGVRVLWSIDQHDPLLHWDGLIPAPSGSSTVQAPAGTYRARLQLQDNGITTYGPMSQPFTLSWGYRTTVKVTNRRTAVATRTATLTQRHARVRAVDGSLRYRSFRTDWPEQPLVRTAHRVRIPSNRVADGPVLLIIRGRWQDELDPDFEIVTPSGRVRNIDMYEAVSLRSRVVAIPRRWIRADGTVRFRLLWSSHPNGVTGTPGRTGRTDAVDVRVTRYVWHNLS